MCSTLSLNAFTLLAVAFFGVVMSQAEAARKPISSSSVSACVPVGGLHFRADLQAVRASERSNVSAFDFPTEHPRDTRADEGCEMIAKPSGLFPRLLAISKGVLKWRKS
jgi:hypothetical protein